MSKETIQCIFGNPDLTPKEIEILQKYFKVNWIFAKNNFIYYIDPESGITTCSPSTILHSRTSKYQFKIINIKTIKEYVNRLQEPKADFDRGNQQPTSGIQCTTSKVTIASGHLEDRTIDFRRRSKAQISKANLSF